MLAIASAALFKLIAAAVSELKSPSFWPAGVPRYTFNAASVWEKTPARFCNSWGVGLGSIMATTLSSLYIVSLLAECLCELLVGLFHLLRERCHACVNVLRIGVGDILARGV